MMSTKSTFSLIALFFLSVLVFSQESKTKTLFIIADGIPADVVEKVSTPHLDAIAAEGGYTRAYVGGERDGYSQTPTISAVGYNSLLTGTWVNKHNVWGNGIKNPNYHYNTIFRFAEEQDPSIKTAVFSTWLDNRTKLIGEGLSETGNIKLDYHFDGFELDTVTFPHDDDRLYIHKIDEHVVNEAARYIKAESPDLSWVYLEYTDDMGHRYGDSDEFHEAIKVLDNQMGRIWEAIQYRTKNFNENWQLFITTDHGRDAKTGKGHGGQTDRERQTWIVTNAKNLNRYFKEEEPGIVDIMPALLRSLNLHPKKDQLWELDGVPITGPVSVCHASTIINNHGLTVSWKALNPDEELKIWVSTTNNFAAGGIDNYKLLKKVKAKKEKINIRLDGGEPEFYKIVIEGKHNSVNTWVIKK